MIRAFRFVRRGKDEPRHLARALHGVPRLVAEVNALVYLRPGDVGCRPRVPPELPALPANPFRQPRRNRRGCSWCAALARALSGAVADDDAHPSPGSSSRTFDSSTAKGSRTYARTPPPRCPWVPRSSSLSLSPPAASQPSSRGDKETGCAFYRQREQLPNFPNLK